jgi:hypothetical protein
MILLFTLNTLFTVAPPLYPFYSVSSAAMLALSSGKGHVLLMLSDGTKKEPKSDSALSSHNERRIVSTEMPKSNPVNID